jgi:hypothetical protein
VPPALVTNLIFEDGQYKMGYTHLVTDADLADLRDVNTTAHHLQEWAPKVTCGFKRSVHWILPGTILAAYGI